MVDYPVIPYTLEGFKRYCFENHGDVGQYFDNKGSYYNDFVVICSRIRMEIREQQIMGGLMGFYNPSITQRLNGLVEKQQNDITVKDITANFGNPIQPSSESTKDS